MNNLLTPYTLSHYGVSVVDMSCTSEQEIVQLYCYKNTTGGPSI